MSGSDSRIVLNSSDNNAIIDILKV